MDNSSLLHGYLSCRYTLPIYQAYRYTGHTVITVDLNEARFFYKYRLNPRDVPDRVRRRSLPQETERSGLNNLLDKAQGYTVKTLRSSTAYVHGVYYLGTFIFILR